jgi:hypothetical protein
MADAGSSSEQVRLLIETLQAGGRAEVLGLSSVYNLVLIAFLWY